MKKGKRTRNEFFKIDKMKIKMKITKRPIRTNFKILG